MPLVSILIFYTCVRDTCAPPNESEDALSLSFLFLSLRFYSIIPFRTSDLKSSASNPSVKNRKFTFYPRIDRRLVNKRIFNLLRPPRATPISQFPLPRPNFLFFRFASSPAPGRARFITVFDQLLRRNEWPIIFFALVSPVNGGNAGGKKYDGR